MAILKHHSLVGLNKRPLPVLEARVHANADSGEIILPSLQMAASPLCPQVTVLPCARGESSLPLLTQQPLTLMTSFNPHYLPKDPISNYHHTEG